MSRLGGFAARLRALVRRRRAEADLDEEIRFHLDMETERNLRAGMAPDEARRVALAHFGGVERVREEHRDVRRPPWLQEFVGDARFAARSLGRVPGLTTTVVLTLALCIGATTAVYDVTRRLLLAPLPYPDGNRIVRLEARSPGDGEFHFSNLNGALVERWATRARTIEDVAALQFVHKRPNAAIRARGVSDTVPAIAMVTPSFLDVLRVRPLLGRGLIAADARVGAPAVALLGEDLWRSRYAGDPSVIGRAITVRGHTWTVVGVVPHEVAVPTQARDPLDILLPLDLRSATASATGIDEGFARLRPGATSGTATRELEAILRSLPDTGSLKGLHAEATTAPEQVDPRRRRAVEVLVAAALGLLLIACANIAGLLLMRGWVRQREFAVRRALGASRGRVARQVLTESLLLAVPSGALGVLVAWMGLRAAVALRPWTLAFLDHLQLDRATLLWAAAAAVATALLSGVGPALIAGCQSLDGALRTGSPGAGRNGAAGRAHAALVVGQIALSLMFLSAAGVLTRSFVDLLRTPVGYDPAGLVAVSVRGSLGQGEIGSLDAAMRAVRDALAATPGVTGVAIGTLPMDHLGPGIAAIDDCSSGGRPVDVPSTSQAYVSRDYFRVARVPLVRGRAFDANTAAAGSEVVINQALARRLWPNRDALGGRLRLDGGQGAAWLTVVGIAGDVSMPGARADAFGLQIYLPASASPDPVGSFVLRARGDPAVLRPLLAQAVERAGVGVTLGGVTAATWLLDFAYGAPRFAVVLFGAFAAIAVVLAGVGLFGIVAYAVARRTREIGVRVALGADPAALTRLILGESVRLVTAGCAVGLLGAFGASRAMTGLVYGVSATDPMALGTAVGFLVVLALGASALPLRRALRVDPTHALRSE